MAAATRTVQCSRPGSGIDDHQRDGSGILGSEWAVTDEMIGKGTRKGKGYWTLALLSVLCRPFSNVGND